MSSLSFLKITPALQRREWMEESRLKAGHQLESCCSVPKGGLHLIMAAGLEENGCFGEIQKGRND